MKDAQTEFDQTKLRTELVGKAAAIVPLLRANGPKADANRRLSDESVAAMQEAGLFRICTPRRFGGHEGNVRTYMDVVAEIGRGCGSAAWIAFISNACGWIASWLPEQAQEDMFANNPDARFCCVLAPTSSSSRAEGGYKVSGRWGYASGCLHAHWALMAAPLSLDDGSKDLGLALMPMSELSIEDTWFSAGVRGSGSNTVVAQDVFVPDHRMMRVSELLAHNAIGKAGQGVVLRQAFSATAIIVVAAPILGMANAALEMTRARMGEGGKRITYSTYADARKSPAMQLQIAEAATLINAGNSIVKGWCDRIVDAAIAGQELPFEERSQLRAELGLAMRNCRDGVDLLLSVQGSSAFMEANPMQRVWRDIETGSRHGLLTPEVPMEIYGRALFGDRPDLSPFV